MFAPAMRYVHVMPMFPAHVIHIPPAHVIHIPPAHVIPSVHATLLHTGIQTNIGCPS